MCNVFSIKKPSIVGRHASENHGCYNGIKMEKTRDLLHNVGVFVQGKVLFCIKYSLEWLSIITFLLLNLSETHEENFILSSLSD